MIKQRCTSVPLQSIELVKHYCAKLCQGKLNKTLSCCRNMLFQSRIGLQLLGRGAAAGLKCTRGVNDGSQVMRLSSVELAYDDYNSKTTSSASPILLSHGMLGSRSNWTSIAKQIHKSTGRRVVAMDARNHGDSPHTDQMCYASMAKDLERLISELQLGPVSLVGHRYNLFYNLGQTF